jgi:thioredoxin 1
MKTSLLSNPKNVLAAILLLGGGLFAYCYYTAGCLFAAPNHTALRPPAKETKLMTTKTKNSIVHVDQENFRFEVLESEVPVLVDFYADWCGPCRALSPVLEKFARETEDAKVVKIDVDTSPELAARYGVNSIPSLLVFRDGRIASQHAGLATKPELERMLNR